MELKSAELLKALMAAAGLSCAALAEHGECSEGMVRHLRKGRRTSCSPELATRLSLALGLTDLGVLFVPKSTTSSTQSGTRVVRRAA